MRALGNAIDSTLAIVADNLTRLGGRVTETEKKVGLVSGTPASFSDTNHAHSNYAASSHSHAYLPTSGGVVSGPLTYGSDSAVPDFNASNYGLVSSGQVKFLMATKLDRNNLNDQEVYARGLRGQPAASHGNDLRYMLINFSDNHRTIYSTTKFPQSRLADTTDSDVLRTRKTIGEVPIPRVIEDPDGSISLGLVPSEIPDIALNLDEDGNPTSYDIIQIAMLSITELHKVKAEIDTLRSKVDALEAKN